MGRHFVDKLRRSKQPFIYKEHTKRITLQESKLTDMAIYATNSGSQRELISAGNYLARCYQMVEIGTVNEVIQGKTKILTKVRIGWELPTELKVFKEGESEKPMVISKEYTLSMNEKSNLRKDLKSWRGKDFTEDEAKKFDITKLIGVPCMLNIIHKPSQDGTKTYQEIAGITGIPKGMDAPKAILPRFELSYDKWDENLFNVLPDFIKQKMQTSLEYAALRQPNEQRMDAEHITEPVDDLPF